MRLLLHMCCAPCSLMPVALLAEEGHEVTGLFYNPNIQPYTEWKNRLSALRDYTDANGLDLLSIEGYELEKFLGLVMKNPQIPQRCGVCYDLRLDRTALEARERGFDAFSTTLLVSPYQQHELIIETAQKAAETHGVAFFYRDFRPHFRAAMKEAREMQMYTQKYCGCIFSERDRYQKKSRGRGR